MQVNQLDPEREGACEFAVHGPDDRFALAGLKNRAYERKVVSGDRAYLDGRRAQRWKHSERMPSVPDRHDRTQPDPFRASEPAEHEADQNTSARPRAHRCQHTQRHAPRPGHPQERFS